MIVYFRGRCKFGQAYLPSFSDVGYATGTVPAGVASKLSSFILSYRYYLDGRRAREIDVSFIIRPKISSLQLNIIPYLEVFISTISASSLGILEAHKPRSWNQEKKGKRHDFQF